LYRDTSSESEIQELSFYPTCVLPVFYVPQRNLISNRFEAMCVVVAVDSIRGHS
jgi:hypothetical protein